MACRLFPFNILFDKKNGYKHGIIMSCPAAKELYVTSQLFLKKLSDFLDSCRYYGKPIFSFSDLERIKADFPYNNVSQEDMNFLKYIAVNPMNK
jgi:hypothetical protein